MAESGKRLHVSFGRFSCTLEGFADPVAALIAVTEHFRDLAARDLRFAASDGMPRAADLDRLARQLRARVGLAGGSGLSSPGFGGAEPNVVLFGGESGDGGMTAGMGGDGPDRDWAMAADGEPPQAQERHALPEADDAALLRLLTESDMRLADPEATRRRSTIASLKAAVAATEAARASGERPGAELEARRDRFRRDLRQVEDEVQGPEQAGHQPHGAPLRLVASQRVDVGREEDVAQGEQQVPVQSVAQPVPVQPVPVQPMPEDPVAQPVSASGGRPGAAEPAADFATFAARMGATTLPDLIEAAAAWRSFVWSTEDVSRPELLQLASEALPGEPSREEGLGAFGTLLNDGRLARVGGGRFRVSEESRFNPGKLAG